MRESGSRFPALGSPNPSYPALCRQATSYAWRNRLRRIPLGRSEDARGEVRKGGARHSVAALGGQNPGRAGLPGIPRPAWRPRWPEARLKGGTEGIGEARHTLLTVCSGGQGRKTSGKTQHIFRGCTRQSERSSMLENPRMHKQKQSTDSFVDKTNYKDGNSPGAP